MLSRNSVATKSALTTLSLAALGVVFGDIGTSPLYAFRVSIAGLPINEFDVLGVLSLIFWALILIVSVKYLCIVLRADNDSEGGVLALMALLQRTAQRRAVKIFFFVGIFGAGLMLGDGMLTPAISVVSAVEGLEIATPAFSYWIIPIACTILLILFSVQYLGTSKIGFMFGPIIFLWFIVIALLGITQIIQNPVVLKAMEPNYAWNFLVGTGWHAYALLGGVFLVVTGGEALYADIGHFGKRPIRCAWFFVALPCLLMNYLGQGALVLSHPDTIANPFYLIAPKWFFIPLIILATLATIIASQAVISATFSLTKQAVLLGLYPHLPIIQTSETEKGQIYIPQMNFILLIGTLFVIFLFKSSSAMAHAYGIAVNLVMIFTTLMVAYAAYSHWRWNAFVVLGVFAGFFFIDSAFLGSNIQKIPHGGWFPIVFACGCALVMYTWEKGMEYLRKVYYTTREDLTKVVKQLHYKSINKLPGLHAVFITDAYDKSGGTFLQFLKLNRSLPENVLILNHTVENVPYINLDNRFRLQNLYEGITQLTLRYGFMDHISIPETIEIAMKNKILPFDIPVESLTYLVEVPNILASKEKQTLRFFWQEKLFAFLMRNYSANLNIEFYHLPYHKTVALGTYYVI